MLSLLFTLLIVAVIVYVVYLIVGMINLPAPIKTIVYLIMGVIVLVYLASLFGIDTGMKRL
jgi:hypothetical protein